MTRYESETKDAILARMLERVADGIDKRQGSVTHDLLSPASIELAQAYIALDNVLGFGFLTENTPREYVLLRAAEQGIYPKAAVKAVGSLTFTGTNGIIVPAGTRVRTDDVSPIYFATAEEGTIAGGSVTVGAVAEEGGASGNVSAGEITVVLSTVSGVTSVTNSQSFDGGADEESDASIIQRYIEKVSKPATSGNVTHYEQWAKSVAGVGDAKVYPIWNGGGTVKVVLLDEQRTAPPQQTIDAVASYIESVRPIGATVTVAGAVEVGIDISATLTLASGSALGDAQAEFEEALGAYFTTLAFVDPIVRYSKIASLLLDNSHVVDYANLTVNGGVANVEVAEGEVAIVGTVTLT